MRRCRVVTVVLMVSPWITRGEVPMRSISLEVSRRRPDAAARYETQQAESRMTLLVTPVDPDRFKPASGRVITSKRHNTLIWRFGLDAASNSETRMKVFSPPIPAAETTYVSAKGVFRVPGAGGSRGGSRGGGEAKLPEWLAQIREPGVIVILAHQYDATVDPQWNVFNRAVQGSVDKMIEVLQGADPIHVVRVGVGTNTADDPCLADITELPGYLDRQGVAAGSVVSLYSLGHGLHWQLAPGKDAALLASGRPQSGGRFAVDPPHAHAVGLSADLDSPPVQLPYEMPTPQFVAQFKTYLKQGAHVALCHCFSGEVYAHMPLAEGGTTSILKQVLLELQDKKCSASGVVGRVDLGTGRFPVPASDARLAVGGFL